MYRFLLLCTALLPGIAFAAGSDNSTPPTPTETTQTCTDGLIWDGDSKSCVAPKDARLDDDTLYGAVRELAYAGQYDAALATLDAMSDQNHDRVLTYRGFVHRKLGQRDLSMAFYKQALTQNPDNILARSYMAQGFVAEGNLEAARLQLAQINTRGGAGSWAQASLAQALAGGKTFGY
ncbi:hypothetical protein ATO10_01860 [Actibacterium atlanticum]|uniref:Uncharacterized protein n=1 Tax=Actibacterium atlanticum TaxID=1461693 RepID=A0A058ZRH6_9RHOB|nr:hypothetical protein [Actibacterium atlanticum]KCV83466.1 hypothetical protein ATO10_01860 [Actibacterium atlanticum]